MNNTNKTPAELRKQASLRYGLMMILFAGALVSLPLGVWVDARWFATAVILFAVATLFSVSADRLELEANRKDRDNARSQD